MAMQEEIFLKKGLMTSDLGMKDVISKQTEVLY